MKIPCTVSVLVCICEQVCRYPCDGRKIVLKNNFKHRGSLQDIHTTTISGNLQNKTQLFNFLKNVLHQSTQGPSSVRTLGVRQSAVCVHSSLCDSDV